MKWLSEYWSDILATLGFVSGMGSGAWTLWTRRQTYRERLLKRIFITTTKVRAGLRADVTFEAFDRAEPLAIEVIVLTPGVHAVQRVHERIGGPDYSPEMQWQTRMRGRRVEIELDHRKPTSTTGTATFALVPSGAPDEASAESSLSMSKVSIRVVMRSSRKRLISTTRTISPAV